MMSAKAAAAVIRALLGIFRGYYLFFLSRTMSAVERQPKVVLLLGVRML